MKRIKFVLVLIFVLSITQDLLAQTVLIDGYAYLENQTVNNNVQIVFKRVAPSILYDTTFTDNNGYFNHVISQGIYNVYYTKSGFISDSIISQTLYSATTLPNITLELVGLSGLLSGIINPGIYKVSGNIEVANNDTLIIEPGVKLLFTYNTEIIINGLLIASGTLTDSIYFISYNDTTWKGIRINNISNDNTIISFAVIEHSNDKGIEVYNANPQLLHLVIKNNIGIPNNVYSSSNAGAGIYLENSQPILENLLITNNNAIWGGGIYAKNSSFTMSDCKLSNNNSHNTAAIELNSNSKVEIINSIICNNKHSNWTLSSPCGIRVDNSSLILRNSIIAKNQYGGVYGNNSYIKSINTLFHCNNGYDQSWPGFVGDGIQINNSEINIVNSIFSSQTLYGIGNYGTNVIKVNRSCFWNNSASYMKTPVNFIGSIVTVNMNGDSCDAYLNIFKNPLFSDTTNFNFILNSNSPCIDGGINDSIYFNTDMLKNVRIFDGNNDSDTIVDIGPYEYGAPVFISSAVSKNYSRQLEYKIYPNPSTGLLSIYLNNKQRTSIEILNVSGQLIYKDNFENNSVIKNINMSNITKGVYIIRLYNEEMIKTDLIILQ